MEKDQKKEWIIRLYLALLLPVGILAVVWAVNGLRLEKMDSGLAIIAVVTVFFSSYLRIQLPRTKIHLTVSDALIFLSILLYGGEVAVILGLMEAGFTSLLFRRQGIMIRKMTVLINVVIATSSVFVTAAALTFAFGPPEMALNDASVSQLVLVLFVMALAQFIVNSVLVSAFISIKSDEPLWHVWNEYCLNALVMYLSGALMAGLLTKALQQIDIYLFAAVAAFFSLVYLTYVRYVNDIRKTSAKAEQAERARAEQAESHVLELEHYVEELERSSEALHESREKFKYAAYNDELTGLPNRRQFVDKITELIDNYRRRTDPAFAVLFLDLNRFKTLNDSLGHSVGDRLIMNVAARLKNIVPESGMVGRFSGDEFAIILPDIIDKTEATGLADSVARQIAEPFSLDGRQVFTSVSVGVAFGSGNYNKAEEILRDADIAMYYAKGDQKPFVVFDKDMHAKAVSLLELETDLRHAVKRREFELFYQPIVTLEDAKINGFEALVRWNHPRRGLISPNNFIPLAESTGVIIPMTVQILRSACEQIVEWQKTFDRPLMVSVNLSGKHFSHPGLVDQIASILDDTHFDPANLKLEITESAVMENAENAIAMLRKIKATGVKISIDDFGTGYSSLSYLHRFPIDTLKVDRSFVSTMEDGTENGEIVRTVIALARALKLTVIAEGIETVHQFHQLRILGCEFGQGYLFSRPLPTSEIMALLRDEGRWGDILPKDDFGVVARNAEYTQLRLTQ